MRVYALADDEGQLFHPIRQAASFAKYSRSPASAMELIRDTGDLAAEKFQKKWVVEYGHNSIAELATLPVAFEGVSMIAAKAIEAWERPGVCEKSTRMQTFSVATRVIPKGIPQAMLDTFGPVIQECFALYDRTLVELPKYVKQRYPEYSQFQVDRAVFDVARYLLPAGCTTSVGICAYPRDIAEMISDFTGSPLSELQDIGAALFDATQSLGGPLIRHTTPDMWARNLTAYAGHNEETPVQLTSCSPRESDVLQSLQEMYGLVPQDLNSVMGDRPTHHAVPKFFREVQLKYRILLDYGAFRDLQRHRRMTQFVEPLTPMYGYSLPPDLSLHPELLDEYRHLLSKFERYPWPTAHDQLAGQYLVPMAFKVGWYVRLDLQELYYLVELRTQEAGHYSYRKVAYDMWRCAMKEYPFLTQWLRPRGPVGDL